MLDRTEGLIDRLGWRGRGQGRNSKKLDGVREEILSACQAGGKRPKSVQVRTIVVDASKAPGTVDWDETFVKPLQGLNVTILINNVGTATTRPDSTYLRFTDVVDDDIMDVYNTNIIFPTLLTKHLIPTLSSNQPSAIVNISSVVGADPMPYLVNYSSTKGALSAFTISLDRELRLEDSTRDMICQAYIVASVQSNNNEASVTFSNPSADGFAKEACRLIGSRRIGYGSYKHVLTAGALHIMPVWVRDWILGNVMSGRRNAWLAEIRKGS